MLANIFKLAIEKFHDMKSSAPDVEYNKFAYRLGYSSLFQNMFMYDLEKTIKDTDEMKNDYSGFHNNIYNRLTCNNSISDCNKKYESTNYDNFSYLNLMSEATKNYITKLCDIVLDDTFDISKETDKNIIINFWLLKFIQVYFEIVSNCNKIYDLGDRHRKCNEVNKIILKISPKSNNVQLHADSNPDFMSLVSFFKNNINKSEMDELYKIISKYYIEIIKFNKYKSKSTTKSISKIPVENKVKKETIVKETIVNDVVSDITKTPKKKKEKIPAAVRKIVWNTYIGKDNNTGKCLCCCAEDISNTNFECGHIKSEKNGGEVNIENLRPICGHCNKSISGNNMDEFMDRYKIKKPSNWNGIN
jgi:5-methylcytosine-specific restriction endonuclease McrA